MTKPGQKVSNTGMICLPVRHGFNAGKTAKVSELPLAIAIHNNWQGTTHAKLFPLPVQGRGWKHGRYSSRLRPPQYLFGESIYFALSVSTKPGMAHSVDNSTLRGYDGASVILTTIQSVLLYII